MEGDISLDTGIVLQVLSVGLSLVPVVSWVLPSSSPALLPVRPQVKIWQSEGKDVYFFCHRPDNKDAPWLAQQFIDLYNNTTPSLVLNNLSSKTQPEQNSLF